MAGNQPIVKVQAGTLKCAVFESVVQGQYGERIVYGAAAAKSVKNNETGAWDEQRINLFDNQLLELAQVLITTWQRLQDYKNKKAEANRNSGGATAQAASAAPDSSVPDDIPF